MQQQQQSIISSSNPPDRLLLLSIPANPSKKQSLDSLKAQFSTQQHSASTTASVAGAQGVASVWPVLDCPEFRLGSLSLLVGVADQLAQDCDQTLSILTKLIGEVEQHLLTQNTIGTNSSSSSLNKKNRFQLQQKYLQVDQVGFLDYCCQFRWNRVKYPVGGSVQQVISTTTTTTAADAGDGDAGSELNVSQTTTKQLARQLQEQVQSMDALMRKKLSSYLSIQSQYQAEQRRHQGSWAARDLWDLMAEFYDQHQQLNSTQTQERPFVCGSEYMVSLVFAVPESKTEQFLRDYETEFGEMVVPRSARLLAKDSTSSSSSQQQQQQDKYCLYVITTFKKFKDQVISDAKAKCGCIHREFDFDEGLSKSVTTTTSSHNHQQQIQLGQQLKKEKGAIQRLFKSYMSELLEAWMHQQVLRVYCESVLRYGPGSSGWQMLVLVPKQQKFMHKIRQVLQAQYAYLQKGAKVNSSAYNNNNNNITAPSEEEEAEMAVALGVVSSSGAADSTLNKEYYGGLVEFDMKWPFF